VVILDRQGRLLAEVTRGRALDLAPAWSPDGRWLLWSSDRSGITNLMAARIDSAGAGVGEARQVTNVLTGAFFPSVGPDGRWIHFSGYHADGFEVERIPFDPATWFEPFPPAPAFADGGGPGGSGRAGATGEAPPQVEGTVEPYSPLPTLVPRYWEPVFRESVTSSGREVVSRSLGLRTSASDLVGRHRVDLEALVSTSGRRASGGVAYRWAGLGNPILAVSAAQSWDAGGPLFGRHDDGSLERLWVAERERTVDADVTLLHPRYRRALSLGMGGGLVWEDRTLLDDALVPSEAFRLRTPRSRLSSLHVSLGVSTVRSHAFSVGPDRGVSLSVLGRTRREMDVADSLRSVVGRDRSTNEVIGRLLLFQDVPGPGYAHHVLAFRASGGAAEGPGADQFHYDVGGASGLREPFTGFSLFGSRSFFFPARGYPNGERVGRYAWSASAEYRFPLALVNQGVGLLPLHLDRLSGTLFFDAANAWGPELGLSGYQNPRQDPLTSAGGEVLARHLTFFSTPV
ncbi:MAG TPA: hypothetical protein VE173_05700, partial [Longimicrobiales bacterium]|nr:hypothetical protein [Longimicrobiales bacterium]